MVSHNDDPPNGRLDDEELLDQAIAEFLRAESAGRAGEVQQWLDRYPACATGLLEFFKDRQQINCVMQPVRAASSSAGGSGLAGPDDSSKNARVQIDVPWNRAREEKAPADDSDGSPVHIDTIEFV